MWQGLANLSLLPQAKEAKEPGSGFQRLLGGTSAILGMCGYASNPGFLTHEAVRASTLTVYVRGRYALAKVCVHAAHTTVPENVRVIPREAQVDRKTTPDAVCIMRKSRLQSRPPPIILVHLKCFALGLAVPHCLPRHHRVHVRIVSRLHIASIIAIRPWRPSSTIRTASCCKVGMYTGLFG